MSFLLRDLSVEFVKFSKESFKEYYLNFKQARKFKLSIDPFFARDIKQKLNNVFSI